MNRVRTAVALLISVSLTGFSQAQTTPKMGAIGDSLLDEHFDQSEVGVNLGYSKNAFEILVDTGRIDAGSTNPGGWGDTRGTGYEYNWALAGSTTQSLIDDGQHTNLAAQASTEGIGKAVLIVGSNDLFPWAPPGGVVTNLASSSGPYQSIYSGLLDQGTIDGFANAAVSRVIVAAGALRDAGMDVVVATAPEYGITPFAQAFYPDAARRELVDDVMQQYNENAKTALTQQGIPVVDLYQLTKDIWGDNTSPNGNGDFKVGNLEVNKLGTGGVDYSDVLAGNPFFPTDATTDAFVHDGIHPSTLVNGVFANLFLEAFNQEYGDSFQLLTAGEILAQTTPSIAGQYDGTSPIVLPDNATYSSYIASAVPEPGTCLLLAVAAGWGYRRRDTILARASSRSMTKQ
ncbi:PEP-CTERM sorting domain-containing protein [Crateriforma conspicua]|uniref:PEP-CTERM protein-sorting domain-containing protein n=1 Tax=Crateriforma conspicua TaxID=2527996 RepID=A0A5C5XWY7_9PLAN|nr:PEP-CTERM sorting domain-containing protein [Crateriforma conspicua]TWT67906.1 hypothetical protein Pan14r_01440 [Crateriforma conspicua]